MAIVIKRTVKYQKSKLISNALKNLIIVICDAIICHFYNVNQ